MLVSALHRRPLFFLSSLGRNIGPHLSLGHTFLPLCSSLAAEFSPSSSLGGSIGESNPRLYSRLCPWDPIPAAPGNSVFQGNLQQYQLPRLSIPKSPTGFFPMAHLRHLPWVTMQQFPGSSGVFPRPSTELALYSPALFPSRVCSSLVT